MLLVKGTVFLLRYFKPQVTGLKLTLSNSSHCFQAFCNSPYGITHQRLVKQLEIDCQQLFTTPSEENKRCKPADSVSYKAAAGDETYRPCRAHLIPPAAKSSATYCHKWAAVKGSPNQADLIPTGATPRCDLGSEGGSIPPLVALVYRVTHVGLPRTVLEQRYSTSSGKHRL